MIASAWNYFNKLFENISTKAEKWLFSGRINFVRIQIRRMKHTLIGFLWLQREQYQPITRRRCVCWRWWSTVTDRRVLHGILLLNLICVSIYCQIRSIDNLCYNLSGKKKFVERIWELLVSGMRKEEAFICISTSTSEVVCIYFAENGKMLCTIAVYFLCIQKVRRQTSVCVTR